jgi:NADH dehydrogenase FAD-containing subunit
MAAEHSIRMLKSRSTTVSLSAILIMTIAPASRFFLFRNHHGADPCGRPTVADAFTSSTVRKRTSARRRFTSSLIRPTSATAVSTADHDAADDAAALGTKEQQKEQHKSYHLVLIGGGHAHVQVVKALANRPHYLKVTLIDMQRTATYSGMVPGCIAGWYDKKDTQIDIANLATQYAGMEFVNDAVVDIDCEAKLIYLKKDQSRPIPFDVVSLDIGSTSRDLYSVPGAARYTIPTRPIDRLVDRLRQLPETTPPAPGGGIVVVGGGVAGIELSMAVSARFRPKSTSCENDAAADDAKTTTTTCYTTTLLDAGSFLLPSEPPNVRQDVAALLDEKGVTVQHHCQVARVDADTIYLKDGRTVPYQHCVWATGAGAHPLARQLQQTRGIAGDQYGWFFVQPTLQSTSHPFIFAAGDCATMVDPLHPQTPSPPKAGVYAVRSGPILIENLTRYIDHLRQQDDDRLAGIHTNKNQHRKQPQQQQQQQQQPHVPSPLTLIASQPQEDFLKLVVCGDGDALGIRFGMTIRGKWVFQMKDDIDRSFMDLFDVTKLPPPPPLRTADRGSYDTSQYDASDDNTATALSASQGAALLQRTDDNVCFREARQVLRRMGHDESYRQDVLAAVGLGTNVVL